ncbi:outer membrane lipoprotein carrier protein LolA, partial [Pseudoxanthomonas sp. SGD-10]
MKNNILKYILGFVCMLFSVSTFAQSDAKAKAILADVSKKFRGYDIVKADFTFEYHNRQSNQKQSYNGTLYVQSKTNKYKVIMPQQEVISDGKTQWTYLKDDKEVQVAEVDNSEDALNPAQIFTMYEKG